MRIGAIGSGDGSQTGSAALAGSKAGGSGDGYQSSEMAGGGVRVGSDGANNRSGGFIDSQEMAGTKIGTTGTGDGNIC